MKNFMKSIAFLTAWAYLIVCLSPSDPSFAVTIVEMDEGTTVSMSVSGVRTRKDADAPIGVSQARNHAPADEACSPLPRQKKSCGTIFGKAVRGLFDLPRRLFTNLFLGSSKIEAPRVSKKKAARMMVRDDMALKTHVCSASHKSSIRKFSALILVGSILAQSHSVVADPEGTNFASEVASTDDNSTEAVSVFTPYSPYSLETSTNVDDQSGIIALGNALKDLPLSVLDLSNNYFNDYILGRDPMCPDSFINMCRNDVLFYGDFAPYRKKCPAIYRTLPRYKTQDATNNDDRIDAIGALVPSPSLPLT